jgi:hypothetical protein
MYESFRDVFVKEYNREQKIGDFNSFLKVFLEFIDIVGHMYPLTRTSFITTKFCHPECSGLVINLREDNHALDRNKYERFLQDKNFDFYTKAARQHGFMIDKNAPWRLVADVFSPAMKKYINKYNISTVRRKEVFENYYYEAYKTELEVLKVYVTQIYNSYVYSEPFQKITKQLPNNGAIITERIERKTIGINDFDNVFWLKIYTYIRARETATTMTQTSFNRLVKDASSIFLKLDKQRALDYINRHLDTKYLLSVDESASIKDLIANSSTKSVDFFF